MLNKFLIIFSIWVVTSSCFHGDRMNTVDYGNLFHNGGSKVWIVSKNNLSTFMEYCDDYSLKNPVFIFHENGQFVLTNFDDLTMKNGIKGSYKIDSNEKIIRLSISKEEVIFNFQSENRHTLILNSFKGDSDEEEIILESIKPF